MLSNLLTLVEAFEPGLYYLRSGRAVEGFLVYGLTAGRFYVLCRSQRQGHLPPHVSINDWTSPICTYVTQTDHPPLADMGTAARIRATAMQCIFTKR